MPPAVSPIGQTPPKPPERIPPPDILEVGKQDENTAAYKDGEFTREKINHTIQQAIQSFHWASNELGVGGPNISPSKAKKTEISGYFQKSAAKLEGYATSLAALIQDLEKQKRQHNLGNTLEILKHQLLILQTLAQAHKEMSKPNQTIEGIFGGGFFRKGKANKLIPEFLAIAQKAEPDYRQEALGHIKHGLGGIPSQAITKALEGYKKQIGKFDDFLHSSSVQALTKSLGSRARVAAQNPNAGLLESSRQAA
jgi:hypothetical protein